MSASTPTQTNAAEFSSFAVVLCSSEIKSSRVELGRGVFVVERNDTDVHLPVRFRFHHGRFLPLSLSLSALWGFW